MTRFFGTNFTKNCILLLFLLISACQNSNQDKGTLAQLRTSFIQPPKEAKVRAYWWWLNGMATKKSITRDLEEMHDKGYGGAIIFDAASSGYWLVDKTPAGPVFGSDAWHELLAHCVKEADRLGLELSLSISSGWNLGGPGVKPEQAMKKIVFTDTIVAGPGYFKGMLPQPAYKHFYQDIAVQAVRQDDSYGQILHWSQKSLNETMGWKGIYPLHILREHKADTPRETAIKADSIIPLNEAYQDRILTWQIPAGAWLILRYGMSGTGVTTSTNSAGAGGLSLDHLSKTALKVYFDDVVVPLIETAQAAGSSLSYLYSDSWEMGNANWTQGFEQFFKAKRGYDITPYLPILTNRVVINREISNRFLHDYRKTVSDAIIENHYAYLKELAVPYGLKIHPESGGPHSAPIDAIKALSVNDFPMGEFWARSNTHRVADAERLSVKQGACVAHVYSKKWMAAEGPTSIGPHWERAPKDLKSVLDRIFCSGVNRVFWHTFTSSPVEFGRPGNEYFAGTHLNPNVTWWQEAKSFITYINRCSYLLSRGLFVADLLIYYGDDTPNFVFLKEENENVPFGYDWDKCDAQAIISRISAAKGNLVLPDGMHYHLLVLPEQKSINLDVLKKIEQLVKAGVTLYGSKPNCATGLTGYPQSDDQVREIAERLWGSDTDTTDRSYGKGRILQGISLAEALNRMEIEPDFSFQGTDSSTQLDYIHRRTAQEEIYYIVNPYAYKDHHSTAYQYRTDKPDNYETVTACFRVSGMQPEVWDPVSGEIYLVEQFTDEKSSISFELTLEPEGGVFVIFRSESDTKPEKNLKDYTGRFNTKPVQVLTIEGPWKLQFTDGFGAPDSIITPVLRSWTSFKEPNMKYYSGHVTYKTQVGIDKARLAGKIVFLDLGSVSELAEVVINGHNLGVIWKTPFRLDVTDVLRSGENELVLNVVNLWCNRLIRDGKLPENERLTQTNVIKFKENGDHFLRESGLLGPVRLLLF
jgi:hypothetical protein